jgi:plasmid stabilization system protein ParE
MNILVTKRASRNYQSIRQYITTDFGERVADVFEEKVIDFFELLRNYPEIGLLEVADKQIRAFQLTKQTRVFYRIKNENIIILTFFIVKQHPVKKPR